jgi:hypothetical protein
VPKDLVHGASSERKGHAGTAPMALEHDADLRWGRGGKSVDILGLATLR